MREIAARHRAAMNAPKIDSPTVASSDRGGGPVAGQGLLLFVEDEKLLMEDAKPLMEDANLLSFVEDDKLLLIDDVIELSRSAAGLLADTQLFLLGADMMSTIVIVQKDFRSIISYCRVWWYYHTHILGKR